VLKNAFKKCIPAKIPWCKLTTAPAVLAKHN